MTSETVRTLHVLVAEDNVINQEVAVGMLESLGHRATVVPDGEKAIAAVAMTTYDVVLMDCHMPCVDGYEATRAIRSQQRSGSRRVPIIALTGTGMPGDAELCFAAGMDDHLLKPYTRKQLQVMLERWSGKSGTGTQPVATVQARVAL